jgi:hypothetical protein
MIEIQLWVIGTILLLICAVIPKLYQLFISEEPDDTTLLIWSYMIVLGLLLITISIVSHLPQFRITP